MAQKETGDVQLQTEEDASVYIVRRNHAAAAVQLLLSSCDNDYFLARQHFREWRESEEAQKPAIRLFIECFEERLNLIEQQQNHLQQSSVDWWKPPE